jgi:cilia- and flagella-associated protein 300
MVFRFYSRGMLDHCYIKRFTYDQQFQSYQIDAFLLDFFNNNPAIPVLSAGDRWGTLGRVEKVEKQETLHNITSLTFFNRLKGTIARVNGDIKKCLDEYYENFLICDELRKCLLMPEFEFYHLFSESDRKEFIFHLFKGLCLGGRLCQFEDQLEPYLEVTKKCYKDLIKYVVLIIEL